MSAPNIVQSNLSLATVYPSQTAGIALRHAYFPVALAGLAGTAAVVNDYTFGVNGHLVSIKYLSTVPASTASKAATITPSLDAVAVTGGVLALTTAKCTAGAVVASETAITALNSFGPTTAFDLVLSSVTAFSQGSGVIDVAYVNEDDLFALANMGLLMDA